MGGTHDGIVSVLFRVAAGVLRIGPHEGADMITGNNLLFQSAIAGFSWHAAFRGR